MSDREQEKTTTVSQDVSTEARSLVDEMLRDLERPAIRPYLDTVEAPEVALARMKGIRTLRNEAVAETEPEQWTLWRMPDGTIMATMNYAASVIIAAGFGIQYQVIAEPHRVQNETGKRSGWRTLLSARCTTGGIIPRIDGTRWDDEQFIGRDVDDLPKASYTLAERKATAILSGLVRVPLSYLARIWQIGADEIVHRANKGRGFGKSTDRPKAPPPPQRAKGAPAPATNTARNGNGTPAKGEVLAKVGADAKRALMGAARSRAVAISQTGGPTISALDLLMEAAKAEGIGGLNDIEDQHVDVIAEYISSYGQEASDADGKLPL